jgi:K+-sensing histidine kinase KdpD
MARSLCGLRPQAQAVLVSIPPDLYLVMADPALLERVIANVTAKRAALVPTDRRRC